MKVITNKDELNLALKNKEREFVIEGKLAEDVKKSQRITKLSKLALAVLAASIAGIALAPITAGTSGVVGSAGVAGVVAYNAFQATAVATAASAGAGGVSITAAVIYAVIALGGITVVIGLFKEYDVEYSIHPKKGLTASFKKK